MFIILFFISIFCSSIPVNAQVDELIQTGSKIKEALVLKVISSDTVVLEKGERIKLIGVDSYGPPPRPKIEYDQSGKPIENTYVEPMVSLEEQAFIIAQDLMENKKVTLEFDVAARDERGNKVAYVYLPDGRMANAELLRQGLVRLRIRPPNVRHEDLLRKAYQEARKEQRGFLSY